MSVLIKGMEMPIEHGVCVFILPNGNVYSDGVILAGKAIPVPPHGRLIDANALASQIEHERFHHTHTNALAVRHHTAEYGHFLKAIVDAPTIIPPSEEGE